MGADLFYLKMRNGIGDRQIEDPTLVGVGCVDGVVIEINLLVGSGRGEFDASTDPGRQRHHELKRFVLGPTDANGTVVGGDFPRGSIQFARMRTDAEEVGSRGDGFDAQHETRQEVRGA